MKTILPSAEQATVLAATTVAGGAFQYYEWDLTSHIIALRNGGAPTVSLLVKNVAVTNNTAAFNSNENAANKPELRVVSVPAPALPLFTSITSIPVRQSQLVSRW